MANQTAIENQKTKDLMAVGCIALSIIGLILGVLHSKPVANTFSTGTILSFVAFLASLGSVKDRGSNLLAIIAFTISFLAMSVCIFFSGLAM